MEGFRATSGVCVHTQVYICTVTALKATYRPAGQPLVKKRTKARFPDPHHTPRSPLNLARSSGHCHISRHDGDNDVWKLEGKGGHEIELTDAFLAESKSTFARLEKEAQVVTAFSLQLSNYCRY